MCFKSGFLVVIETKSLIYETNVACRLFGIVIIKHANVKVIRRMQWLVGCACIYWFEN